MGQLQGIESQLKEIGYQIVAISPDRPAKLAEGTKGKSLEFTLLSDSEMSVARAFGIAYRVDDPTLEMFEKYGIDLEGASGFKHHQLPVPSVFLIDADGVIRFQYVNPDYKTRLDADVLLAVARAEAK